MTRGIKTIIAAATEASASDPFLVMDGHAVTLVAWGMSGVADNALIALQITYDGTNYVNCFKEGSQVFLTSINNPLTIYGPGVYRINKDVTTGEVGVAKLEGPG